MLKHEHRVKENVETPKQQETTGNQEQGTNRVSPVGAILAGGRSSRMGTNKALIPLHGKPMIAWTIETLQSVFDHVFIVADDGSKYASWDVRVVPDIIKDSGPLGGIHAALTTAAPAPVCVMPCDMPYVSAELLKELVGKESAHPVRILWDGIHRYPLCGLYQQSVLPVITARLRQRQLRMTDLLAEVGAELINPLENPRFHATMLANVNSPHDLE